MNEPKPRRCTNPNCAQPNKTEADFYSNGKGRLKSWCKVCSNLRASKWMKEHPESHRAYGKNWREGNIEHARKMERVRKRKEQKESPERIIEGVRRRRYGISVEDQRRMWEAQSGRCLVCSDVLIYSKAHLDHNHETGRVRGFLCKGCNTVIGWTNEDPKRLRRIAAYVQAFNSDHPDPHTMLLNLRSIGGF